MVTFSLNSDSVTLRDPDFDNTERFEVSRINQKSRGGTLFIYRDPMWPTAKILDMKFSFLTELQTQELLGFLDRNLGQVITYLDYEGRTWSGIITTPAGEIAQPLRQSKTAHLIFQGDLV
jgi:hypothetical protein